MRRVLIPGCMLLSLGAGAQARAGDQAAQAAQATPAAPSMASTIGSYYPTQLVAGETTILHVASATNNPIQSIEITPSTGVTVMGMSQRNLNQGSIWFEFTIAVAKDAVPGPRMLVATMRNGLARPVPVMIPSHLPRVSDLKVLTAQGNQPMVDVQFAAVDQGGTFDASPYVWFTLACGAGQPEVGVVRGKFADGTIRASIPNPRAQAGRAGAPGAANHCDLQVRATDSSGVDSNTTMTTVDFK